MSSLYKDHDASKTNEISHNRFFQGCARKLVIVPSLVLIVGWILCTIGVGMIYSQVQYWAVDGTLFGIMFFGLPTVFLILAHAGSWGVASTTLGVVTSFLLAAYTFCLGYLFYGALNVISLHDDIDVAFYLMFTGSLISVIAIAFVLSLWPFYQRSGSWTVEVDLQRGPLDRPQDLNSVHRFDPASPSAPLLEARTDVEPPAPQDNIYTV